ncbi:MAG: TolC family protein [Magnetospirillum sp.]|nr:TolC family protein [Magnetospirillum sp.]
MLVAFAVVCAGPTAAQTLGDDLEDLLINHPLIKAKTKAVNSAGEGVDVARSGYFPTVKVTGDSGPEYVDSPSRRSTEGHRFYKGRETAGITITQKVFDGFTTGSAVDAAKISKEAAGADLRTNRQLTLFEGVTAYLSVLRYTKLIGLARESERNVQAQQNLEDERVTKGAGIASDVLAAKQRLQLAKEARVRYEGEFHTATAKYTQVFGRAPDTARLTDPPVPEDLLPRSLEEALDIARQENPQVEAAIRQMELTDEKRRGAEGGFYPTIDLVGAANYENDKNATVGVRRDWSLLVKASWELFAGLKTASQVAQASFDHAASKDSHLHMTRKVAEQVRTTWYRLSIARERMALLDNAAVLAEEVWEARKKQREAGKATVQEVLDEETKIYDSRIAHAGAYFDMLQSSYELLQAIGRLEAETLAEPATTARR